MFNTAKNISAARPEIKTLRFRGITMAELLAGLIISAMVVSTAVALYMNIQRSLRSIESEINKSSLSEEVMQLLAEDLDRIGSADFDVSLSLEKRQNNGYEIFKLEIKNLLYGSDNKPVEFETIIWQTDYNIDTDKLILYRGRTGLGPEDPVLDTHAREYPENMIFVPVCDGITYFKLEVYNGQAFGDSWSGKTMPTGIRGEISFSDPIVGIDGSLQLLQEDIYTRMIALNREKNLQFRFEKKDLEAIYGTGEEEEAETEDEENEDPQTEEDNGRGSPLAVPEELPE
ncbi:hypothetical protein SMSP2_02638 [Limihaloglobus sulfuriphilus]|uniref:Tfp pilus assembly protein PilW n=1 Tax=Limihaloglobus sulfuriphilus TaxID=1851148 RepID=A0A1Q2MIV9_9BACT|nr:hypothetical protein [Limihaloglobus sulfuriphilus]AQQ72257.1 hypothetical protein SMSP2_02638 [Limihaloglobus sulfuriphilus]